MAAGVTLYSCHTPSGQSRTYSVPSGAAVAEAGVRILRNRSRLGGSPACCPEAAEHVKHNKHRDRIRSPETLVHRLGFDAIMMFLQL